MKKVLFFLALAYFSVQLLIGQNVTGSGDDRDPTPVAWWKFDSDHSRKVVDQISMIADSIEGNYKLVDGIEGKPLKLDGFTTVIKRSGSEVPKLLGSFSFEAWIAAATYYKSIPGPCHECLETYVVKSFKDHNSVLVTYA